MRPASPVHPLTTKFSKRIHRSFVRHVDAGTTSLLTSNVLSRIVPRQRGRKGWWKKDRVKGLIKVTLAERCCPLIPLIRGYTRYYYSPRSSWIDTWCESEKVFEDRGWRARTFSTYAVAWMLNGSGGCDLWAPWEFPWNVWGISDVNLVCFRENNRAGFNRRWDINDIYGGLWTNDHWFRIVNYLIFFLSFFHCKLKISNVSGSRFTKIDIWYFFLWDF